MSRHDAVPMKNNWESLSSFTYSLGHDAGHDAVPMKSLPLMKLCFITQKQRQIDDFQYHRCQILKVINLALFVQKRPYRGSHDLRKLDYKNQNIKIYCEYCLISSSLTIGFMKIGKPSSPPFENTRNGHQNTTTTRKYHSQRRGVRPDSPAAPSTIQRAI